MLKELVDLENWLLDFYQAIRYLDPWLVGGAARFIDGRSNEYPKDIDILVPSTKKNFIERHTKCFVPTTTPWGARKFMFQGCSVDLWADDIGTYLRRVPTAFDGIAIHIGTRMKLATPEYLAGVNKIIEGRSLSLPKFKPYYYEHLRKQGLAIDETSNS